MRVKLIKNPYEGIGVYPTLELPQILDIEDDYDFGDKEGLPCRISDLLFVPREYIKGVKTGVGRFVISADCYEVIECKILSAFKTMQVKLDMAMFKQNLMIKNLSWNINRLAEERNKVGHLPYGM
jgi:hypothetical protein